MDIFMIFMIEYDQENFTVFMSFHKKCIVSSILYSLTLLFRNEKFYWVRKYSKSTRKTCNFRIIIRSRDPWTKTSRSDQGRLGPGPKKFGDRSKIHFDFKQLLALADSK